MSALPIQSAHVQASSRFTFCRPSLRPDGIARAILSVLLFFVSLLATGSAAAVVITYQVTPEAAHRWTYQYTVSAAPSDPAIDEFTIFFNRSLYANLRLVSAPPGWDALVIEPDPELPADGFVDVLTLGAGIAPGSALDGLIVSFDFLGNGQPGAQAFDIVDPISFSTISSGFTRPEETAEVPEPASFWLMAPTLLFLLRSRSRRRRDPTFCSTDCTYPHS